MHIMQVTWINACAAVALAFFPIDWNADGSHMQLGTPLRIQGEVNRPPDPTVTVLADFEGDSLPAGWTATGDALRGNPAHGSLPHQMTVTGFTRTSPSIRRRPPLRSASSSRIIGQAR